MRYIGSKVKLIDEIDKLIQSKNIKKENYTFCDAFSGTATVGSHFKNLFKIIANDNLYFSFVMSWAKLNTPNLKFENLGFNPFDYFNNSKSELKGFVYSNYAPELSSRKYFSVENAKRIDFFRTKIEQWYKKEKLNEGEYYYLIACLLESVSKVANIAGVYGSFLKSWDPRAIKPIKFIAVEQDKITAKYKNEIYNDNIENLISEISGDILYLDPPYTKNQYSVQYHILETIAKYDNPEIKGITGARDTSMQTSNFSKNGAVFVEFEKIIANAKFSHIIFSYSSDGLMSKEYIEKVFKRYGISETFELRKINYNKYENHQTSKKHKHLEYLFYIKKSRSLIPKFASPLNYIGGKADMIDFLKGNMPQKIDRFIDIFAGGYNVGINIHATQIIYNDYNHIVKNLIECFRNTDTVKIIQFINKMIKKYKLERFNKESYLKLRDYYNSVLPQKRDPRILYLLIMYGFNQQIRFNSHFDCNNPVGQAGFNDCILDKLISFSRIIKEQNLIFESKKFNEINEYINEKSFVYADPPYLVTLGSYNDGKRGFNGWSSDDEIKLLEFLDSLNEKNIKFMLSNVLEHKGVKNNILIKWIKNRPNYNLIKYDKSARKNREEIIIINYKKEQFD